LEPFGAMSPPDPPKSWKPTLQRILFACALLLASAPAAFALEIEDTAVRISGDYLVVYVSVESLFSEEVAERLEKGMPATLEITADLWRDRSNWFDHMVATRTAIYRMRYDVWSDHYEIQRDESDVHTLSTIDTLTMLLERPQRVTVTEAARLNPEHRYYVALNVYLKPLTLEDVEDVEKYLGRTTRETPSLGSVAKLPTALVSLMMAVSGFEDEAASAKTRLFRVPESVRNAKAEPDSAKSD
jgi:hypothetical protein